ncbi:MAG: YceD family protein [Paracoccaceae bacterium]
MPDTLSLPFTVRNLSPRKATRFALKPDVAACAAVAAELGITAVRRLSFIGELRPAGRRDIVLEARLEAEVEQPCGITLAPVRTVIGEAVTRRYLADWVEPTGAEAEIPEDDTSEALPDVIDAGAVAIEALALALPLYPRAPGAELGRVVHTEPGQEALTDDAIKPFASLVAFKAQLEKK